MSTTSILLMIGGLWLIIFGLIFLFLASKEYNKIDKICPGCSMPVSVHSHVCSACGRDLHKSYHKPKRDFFLYGGMGLGIIGIVCIILTICFTIL